ncbi:hypothetical protein RRG08_030953 [Elysia crispata]|uniref:Uncharacterized protein n=1 Tax=Elysia crispata TaxID=231223 RepID=A0AAE1AAU2_9GAST|nr:hypothetical protein RRG08_030953 [Elysia crispata]
MPDWAAFEKLTGAVEKACWSYREKRGGGILIHGYSQIRGLWIEFRRLCNTKEGLVTLLISSQPSSPSPQAHLLGPGQLLAGEVNPRLSCRQNELLRHGRFSSLRWNLAINFACLASLRLRDDLERVFDMRGDYPGASDISTLPTRVTPASKMTSALRAGFQAKLVIDNTTEGTYNAL